MQDTYLPCYETFIKLMDIEDKIAQSTVNDSNLSLLINREMENISLFQKILIQGVSYRIGPN